jgi:uncharacterized protein YeaO (DUF488 family)
MIRTKRVYEPAAKTDGKRFLVDRFWPRGTKKESLAMDDWVRDVAPSKELCKWFSHDPEKWPEFRKRYRAELKKRPEVWEPLIAAAKKDGVTLLFSAHDTEHNNAVALKKFLEGRK